MKILIGEISSYKAIVISRYIKKNYGGVTIFTYDLIRRSSFIRTRYSDKHFYVEPKNIENELAQLIKKEAIDFLFPVINNSLTQLLLQKEKFGKTLNYIGDLEPYRILNDKKQLHILASSMDIKVPSLYKNLDDAILPIVIKPSNLSSAVGVNYYFSSDQLNNLTEVKDDHIIQQFVEGMGVGYSFYCKDGVISNGYGHQRLAEYPVTGGSSTYRSGFENNKMHEISAKIVKKLKYTGFAMFEFKLTENNELYLLEVNPRIWGSVNQGIADKRINYFSEILGEPDRYKEEKNRNINTYIAPLIYLSLFGYLKRGEFRPVGRFFKNIFKNKADVGAFNDPLGFMSIILRKIL